MGKRTNSPRQIAVKIEKHAAPERLRALLLEDAFSKSLAAVRPMAEQRLLTDGIEMPSPGDLFEWIGVDHRDRLLPVFEEICAALSLAYALGFTLGQLAPTFGREHTP